MKLWLVVVQDKELRGEPDIGLAVVEGNRAAADEAMRTMEAECIKNGRGRCVGRVREMERSKHYRATALVRTGT